MVPRGITQFFWVKTLDTVYTIKYISVTQFFCVTCYGMLTHEEREKGAMQMNFGQLLKEARKKSERTLKEVGQAAGLSISYVSDVEQRRRKPPGEEVIKKIETFLGITDGSLLKVAQSENDLQVEVKTIFRKRPELNMQLLRASDFYSEKELTEMINEMIKNKGTKNEPT
jgi:transcriptional regulator with XRE-family HTH domain